MSKVKIAPKAPQAHQPPPATDPATEGGVVVEITNHLKIPVDIYDVFNPADNQEIVPYLYTKLGSIAAGKTGNVTTIRDVALLQAMVTGPVSELDNKYYYQFPVKFMSGTQLKFDSQDDAPMRYTIEEADRLAAIQSFLFHKFAIANPGSTLTSGLNTAMKTGKADTINLFFSKTQNFKNCTFASWNAIMTWLQQFTSGWQGTYYLYQKAPDQMPAGYAPVLVAVFNILSDAQHDSALLKTCTADGSGNPVYATPAQETTVVMTGDGTMTDASPGTDTTLRLTPVWMNIPQPDTSGNSGTTNSIGSAVCGTVAGSDVISTPALRPAPGSNSKSKGFFDGLFSNAGATLSTLVGLIMLYDVFSRLAGKYLVKKEKAKSEAKNDKDLEAKQKKIESDASKELAGEVSSPASEAVMNKAAQIKDVKAEAAQREAGNRALDDMEKNLKDTVEGLEENGTTPSKEFNDAIAQAKNSINDARTKIAEGDFAGAEKSMTNASKGLQDTYNDQMEKMSAEERGALQESSEALAEQSKEFEEAARENENNDDGSEESDDGGGEAERPGEGIMGR